MQSLQIKKKLEEYRVEIRRGHNEKLFIKRRIEMLRRSQLDQLAQQSLLEILMDNFHKLEILLPLQHEQKLVEAIKEIEFCFMKGSNLIEKCLYETKLLLLCEKLIEEFQAICQDRENRKFINRVLIKLLSDCSYFQVGPKISDQLALISFFKRNMSIDSANIYFVIRFFANSSLDKETFPSIWNQKIFDDMMETLGKYWSNQLLLSCMFDFFYNFLQSAHKNKRKVEYFDLNNLHRLMNLSSQMMANHYYWIAERKKQQIVMLSIQIIKVLYVNMQMDYNHHKNNYYFDLLRAQQSYCSFDIKSSLLQIISREIYLSDDISIELVTNTMLLHSLHQLGHDYQYYVIQILANLATIVSIHSNLKVITASIVEQYIHEDIQVVRKQLLRYISNWFVCKKYKISEPDLYYLETLAMGTNDSEIIDQIDLWRTLIYNGYCGKVPNYIYEQLQQYQKDDKNL